jgi:hypothetical protein
VRKSIILAIGLSVAGLTLLAGCSNSDEKASGIPVKPKWPGAAYHIAFDTQAPKPNPSGVAIPAVKFTANPEALERRATLVVRFDSTGAKSNQAIMDQMMVGPFDISGAEGAVPADYMDTADKSLARLLGAYCMKGKVKVSVALARSSLSPQAEDAEVNAKRLSDWLPIEIVFKNPHPHC